VRNHPPQLCSRPVIPDLSRCADGLEFVRANKLIAFHRDCNFELRNIFLYRRLVAAQYLAQTPDSHRWCASRQRDQIFDPAADLKIRWRQKTDASRTNVARLLGPVHRLIAQLYDLKRELEPVPLCTSLFQDSLYCISILLSNQSVIVP
jgi:hypothetical protein